MKRSCVVQLPGLFALIFSGFILGCVSNSEENKPSGGFQAHDGRYVGSNSNKGKAILEIESSKMVFKRFYGGGADHSPIPSLASATELEFYGAIDSTFTDSMLGGTKVLYLVFRIDSLATPLPDGSHLIRSTDMLVNTKFDKSGSTPYYHLTAVSFLDSEKPAIQIEAIMAYRQ